MNETKKEGDKEKVRGVGVVCRVRDKTTSKPIPDIISMPEKVLASSWTVPTHWTILFIFLLNIILFHFTKYSDHFMDTSSLPFPHH